MHKKRIFLVISVLALIFHGACFRQGSDSTIQERVNGMPVVDATLKKIKNACLFKNDYYFMRRIAWVESYFGADANTFNQSEPKGIWQLSHNGFQNTQDTSAYPDLTSLYLKINAELGINWTSITYSDSNMNKALYNSLAARIYLNNKGVTIPPDVNQQANFWASNYSIKSNATADKFLKEIESIPLWRSMGVDLVILLDGSASITYAGFKKMKSVVYQIVNSTDIGLNRTKVSIFVFSDSVTQAVSFSDSNLQSKNKLLKLINNLPYPGGGTYTHLALAQAISEYDLARNLSLGFPRQLIILTDGQSNIADLTVMQAAKLRNLTWLESSSIGMGPDFTSSGTPLQEISNIASLPSCTHVLTTPTISQISVLTDELRDSSCQASAQVCDQTNCPASITGQVSSGDVRYFKDQTDFKVGGSYHLNTSRWVLILYLSIISRTREWVCTI